MSISRSAMIGFLGSALLILSSCTPLLYQPLFTYAVDPTELKPEPEQFWIPQTSSDQIGAWYFRSRSKAKVIGTKNILLIHFHGNAENLSTHFRGMEWVTEMGLDYLIFDYRGYGKSTGRASPQSTVEDGITVVDWAHKRWPDKKIALFGQSLGGAVALRTAIELKKLEIPIHSVTVECGFGSYRSAARSVMASHWFSWPFQWFGWLSMNDSFAPTGNIAKISPTPILVIHGTEDKIIDVDLGRDVFNEASQPKEFWEVKNAGHIQAFWTRELTYRNQFIQYLYRVSR